MLSSISQDARCNACACESNLNGSTRVVGGLQRTARDRGMRAAISRLDSKVHRRIAPGETVVTLEAIEQGHRQRALRRLDHIQRKAGQRASGRFSSPDQMLAHARVAGYGSAPYQ